jgi:hypothetical protein
MKKLIWTMLVLFFVVGLMGFNGSNILGQRQCLAAEEAPVIMTATPYVMMASKKTKPVVIMGMNFKPGQTVRLLFTNSDGVQSDIGYALKPEPKANNIGTFSTTWACARYVQRKIVKGGAYKISVTDEDYNPIAHTVVYFQKPAEKKK